MENKIIEAIVTSLTLLGAKSDLIGTVSSWKHELSETEVLAGINAWNENKIQELKERLSLSGINEKMKWANTGDKIAMRS